MKKTAKELRLGRHFPRTASCSRENTEGISFIKPLKMVAMLARKIFIGNLRKISKTSKILKMQEEALTIENGSNWKGIEKITNEHSMWSEEAC